MTVAPLPQFLGKLSFGIYLWKVPFFYIPSFVPRWLLPADAATSGLIISVVIIPISIALAALSYRLFEAPGIALGKKLVQPSLILRFFRPRRKSLRHSPGVNSPA